MATDLLLLLLLQSPSNLTSHLKQLLSSTCNKLSTEPGMSNISPPKSKNKRKVTRDFHTCIYLFVNSTKDMRLLTAWGPQSKGKDSKVLEVGPHGSRASNDDQP
jgi:hypothetical protein